MKLPVVRGDAYRYLVIIIGIYNVNTLSRLIDQIIKAHYSDRHTTIVCKERDKKAGR